MRVLFLILCSLLSCNLTCQERFVMGQDKVVEECSGLFQDSGGEQQPYRANENETIVICADNSTGTHTKLIFSNSDLAPGDVLCFYDGNNVEAPLLSCSSEYYPGSPFVIQATATNNSGCLTVTFKSNNSEQGMGWNAVIDCIPACQLIQVDLEKTEPTAVPIDTGWIDVCIGERVFFDGKGIFPQNGLVYEHSAFTSIFEWDFGDGFTAKGPSVSHAYQASGGYKVELVITDQFGCKSSNFITQRVRVSTKPIFDIQDNFPKEVCEGDTILLNGGIAGTDEMANITVATTQGAFQTRGTRSDSLALPDGNGRSYETSITFTDYSPGAILTKVEDLLSICLNMEHSWLHDMEISITCPNGKVVNLQEQGLINDEVFLGIPNDDDGINPSPGIGKEYCWTPTATYGNLTEFANRENDSGLGEPYFLPEGVFNSFEPFSELIGCPLNGEWTITVTDLWEQDNGWIFSWGIEFDPILIPQLEIYQPQIASFQWADHPTIIEKNPPEQPMNIAAIPSTPGMVSYLFETVDDYGCKSDTSIQVKVLPKNHEDCLKCESSLFAIDELTLCEGENTNLSAYIRPNALGATTFENQENVPFGKNTGMATITSNLEVSGIAPDQISSSLEELVSVCVNLETSFTGDITLFLRTPSGNVITLTKENGGDSNNFTQTCFSPKANLSIENSTGPFTGVFVPKDEFSTLVGENINGTWSLIASGNPGLIESYVLESWSLSFQGENKALFSWSPGTNISSTVGLNTTLSAQTDSHPYYVLTKEENGCTASDTLQVTIIPASVPIAVDYYNFPGGEVLFYWDHIPDVKKYEISEDGINWRSTDDDFFHREKGLQNGQSKTFQFRAIFAEQNCETIPTPLVVNYLVCDLEAISLEQNILLSCAGKQDAALEIRATGGTPPYQFVLNDSLVQDNGTFSNLGVGWYEVLVFDQNRVCGDTLVIQVNSPDSLGVDFTIAPPSCADKQDASITALPFGGVGGFTNITWKGLVDSNNTLNNLSAGPYIYTAEDANGCSITDTAFIEAPLPLELTKTQNPVSCFGKADGSAGVKVKGGTPTYKYQWNNGQDSPDAIGLGIGNYTVTVSDANGCSETVETEVTQPPPIEISFKSTAISCANEEDATLIAEAIGGIGPPYKYKWENKQNSKLNFGLGIGTFFVTVTDGQGCEEIASENIKATSPVIVSATPVAPSCAGTATGRIELSPTGGAAPYQFLWDDSLQQTTAIVTNLMAGEYTVLVTDSLGCENLVTTTLEDAPAFTVDLMQQAASCQNTPDGAGEIIATGGTPPYRYKWEDGYQDPIQDQLLPGNYPVTILDQEDCILQDTVRITAPTAIKLDTLLSRLPNCEGGTNGALTAVASGGTAPYIFEWEGAGLQNPIEGIAAGFYDLKITDSKGCSLSIPNLQLVEPSTLSVQVEKEDVSCFGLATGSATAIPEGGIPPYSYRWSDGKNQNDSIAIDLFEGIYEVTIEDQNGCQETASTMIAQPTEALTIDVTQTRIGCADMANSAAVIEVSGGTGPDYSYNWEGLTIATATANELEAKTYSITVTDKNNCTAQSAITIEELLPIEANLISQEPSCFNISDGSISISTISGGSGNGNLANYNFRWNTQDNTPQISNLEGDSIYQLTITDNENCNLIIERFLGTPPEINLNYEAKDLTCFEDNSGSIRINGTTTQEAITQYQWNHLGSSSDSAAIGGLSAGAYQVIATTAADCKIIQQFTIQQPPSIQITNPSTTPNICFNDKKGSIQFQVEGGTNNYLYQWSNDASTATLENIDEGIYQVTVTDENNCTVEETFTIDGPDPILGTIIATPTSCFGDEDGAFELSATGGTPPYMYSLDGNRYQPSNRFIGLAAGTYTTFIQDNKGCIWEKNNEAIDPGDVLVLDIQAEQEVVNLGDSTTLTAIANSNQRGIQLSWSSINLEAFTCIDANCESISVNPQTSTSFEVYAVDAAGCEAEASFFLRLSNPKKVFVPTGFSPNEDGFNDLLLIHGDSNIKVNYFRIYDRWGEELYAATDFFINDRTVFWDGTFRGQLLNGGIYTWIMEVEYIDQQQEIFKGSTTLFR